MDKNKYILVEIIDDINPELTQDEKNTAKNMYLEHIKKNKKNKNIITVCRKVYIDHSTY